MLRKNTLDYVIPGVTAVTAQPASLVCAVPTPPPTDPNAPVTPPPPTGLQPGATIYVYVPKYFTLFTNQETRTPSVYPGPAGYTCTTGIFLLDDPSFPNGSTPVYETRCYWNYP